MEKERRCMDCNGSKKIMGGGCVSMDCPYCEGMGYVSYEDIKETASYKEAKEKITSLGMSEMDAEKLLDEELKDVDTQRKRGRPRKIISL